MIRSFEQQLGAWVAQIAAESSPLFGAPTVVAGSLDPNSVQPGHTGVLVQVLSLTPAPEHRDLGPPPVTEDDRAPLTADVTVLLVGPVAAAGGLTVAPVGAQVHQVDLLALTVCARLRERSAPGPDGANPKRGGSRGSVTAQAGERMAQLSWDAVESGVPVLLQNSQNRRQWQLPLHAKLDYHLSTLPVDGGRIRAVGLFNDFLPGDRLPLADFIGMEGFMVQRLAQAGITRLGDLATKDAAALAGSLHITDPGARQALASVSAIATLRYNFTAAVPFSDLIAEVLWLPARALWGPTVGEAAILARANQKPLVAATIAVLGFGTAAILRPELVETTLVGRLLAQERFA